MSRAVGGLALDASVGWPAPLGGRGRRHGRTDRTGDVRLRGDPVRRARATDQPERCSRPSIWPVRCCAEAGIRVRLAGIQVIAEPAPLRALDPHANQRLLLDDVLGRTEFYRRHTARVDLATAVVGARSR